jgi:hypothetical protein
MGPEPLPRGQYPVSMLFVIIIQVYGIRQGTLYIALSQWRSQRGNHPYRFKRIDRVGSTRKAGQSKPQGMRE